MESSKANKEQVCCFGYKLRVHKHRRCRAASHVKGSDDVLSLGLSAVTFSLVEKVLHKPSVFVRQLLLGRKFLLKSLLLQSGFHLILVLDRLSPHLLLLTDTLFISLSAHLAHLLLLSQSFLVSLELKLHLILRSAFGHLRVVLCSLSLFLLLDLHSLDLELLGVLRDL